MSERVLAPLGRRVVELTRTVDYGPYRVIECSDPSGPRPQPGQFYMLASERQWGGGADERPFLSRAFSVLREQEGALHFLFEDVGPGTHRLCQLTVGERLALLGPLGSPFKLPPERTRSLLVGGGVGIAPLAILSDRLDEGQTVLLGFRDQARAEAAQLIEGAQVATDDGSVGYHGLITNLLKRELAEDGSAVVYACGPPQMLEAVRALCSECEVPAQLALESPMACGFGACFGCVVPTKEGYLRLCVDGPVLAADLLETALVPGSGH